MKDIYVNRNGNQEGPYSEDEINSLLAKNELSPDDHIWREGMPEWSPVSELLNSPEPVAIEDFIPETLKPATSTLGIKEERWVIEESDGTLKVYEDYLSITPKGILSFLNKGLQGTKTIYFHSITGIQLKAASIFTVGYIQFTIPGGSESKRGILEAVTDENTFVFREDNNNKATVVKNFIEGKIKDLHSPRHTASGSLTDELLKLADLKKQGLLSDIEFEAAKKRLLG